jgi:hypothetical protein
MSLTDDAAAMLKEKLSERPEWDPDMVERYVATFRKMMVNEQWRGRTEAEALDIVSEELSVFWSRLYPDMPQVWDGQHR